jgi:hypothetical protein
MPFHFHNTVDTAKHIYHRKVTVKFVWHIINKSSCTISSIKTYKLILEILKHTMALVMDLHICNSYILMKHMLIHV